MPVLRFPIALLILFAGALSPCLSQTTSAINPKQLPLGDGKYTTIAPAVGWIYACRAGMNGPGANGSTPWIDEHAHTFDLTSKPSVQGQVEWPQHKYTIQLDGSMRRILTNDLPNHTTGNFPVASSDPAYSHDRNPNHIAEQTLVYTLPAEPTLLAQPACLGGGPIGFLLSGVVIFNGLDAGGRDAVAHEMQDSCQGHPQQESEYHYHNLTRCLPDPGTGHSNLLGYALDGFGIYGVRGEDGRELTNADLDICHGHTHAIQWDGKTVVMYHYHATREYPYTLGCFRGTPVRDRPKGPPGNRRGPPPDAPQPTAVVLPADESSWHNLKAEEN
jgi:hypothetical protein